MISGHGPITKNSELSLARGIAGSAESAIDRMPLAQLHAVRKNYTIEMLIGIIDHDISYFYGKIESNLDRYL